MKSASPCYHSLICTAQRSNNKFLVQNYEPIIIIIIFNTEETQRYMHAHTHKSSSLLSKVLCDVVPSLRCSHTHTHALQKNSRLTQVITSMVTPKAAQQLKRAVLFLITLEPLNMDHAAMLQITSQNLPPIPYHPHPPLQTTRFNWLLLMLHRLGNSLHSRSNPHSSTPPAPPARENGEGV